MMDKTDWDQRYAADDLRSAGEPSRFLVAEAAALPPGRALDLACGQGRHAVWLAARGWRVTGVDFSQIGLAKARRLAAAQSVEPDWIAADLVDFEPEQGAYDLVLVFYLQVPGPERQVILRRAAGAVAPGGTLLVVAHHRDNLEHGYGGPHNPAVLYTAEEIVAGLDGLEPQRVEQVERSVPTPDGDRIALDLVVRAVRPLTQQ